jgi:hypothetical protein
MRFVTIILVGISAVGVVGCTAAPDDGYLAPPGYGEFDLRAATERAHHELADATYRGVTGDLDCRKACDVFERGFHQARRLRITSPAKCTDEFEDGLWSQTEYQEGCRAYTLGVIQLIERYREEGRFINAG